VYPICKVLITAHFEPSRLLQTLDCFAGTTQVRTLHGRTRISLNLSAIPESSNQKSRPHDIANAPRPAYT
jgi:hypothetical protein